MRESELLKKALDHITNYCGTHYGSCEKCPIADAQEYGNSCEEILMALAGHEPTNRCRDCFYYDSFRHDQNRHDAGRCWYQGGTKQPLKKFPWQYCDEFKSKEVEND